MSTQMVTIKTTARIDRPLEGEMSRTKPDQYGNVAGMNVHEMVDRYIETGGRNATDGPVKKVTIFWLGGMSCDGCTYATLGATDPSLEELLTGSFPGIPAVVLHHYTYTLESGDFFTEAMQRAERRELDHPYIIVYEGSICDENLTMEESRGRPRVPCRCGLRSTSAGASRPRSGCGGSRPERPPASRSARARAGAGSPRRSATRPAP